MLYALHEAGRAAVLPGRWSVGIGQLLLDERINPWAATLPGRIGRAALDVVESVTRRYDKPQFGITEISVDGERVAVVEETLVNEPFCRLLRFRRADAATLPRLLIVAPLSGHYATLLRDTVRGMLPFAEVFITDWTDARMVPVSEGPFDLDDYIDQVIRYLTILGPRVHVMAVCQPSVPVLAAVALLAARGDAAQPLSMTLMGGPIDTRLNPTVPNQLATTRPLSWFRNNVIVRVPPGYPGLWRQVYPGFLQLTGFMSMNLDVHLSAHARFFSHLVRGDGDSAAQHRRFYEEYLAVMDLPAEFYLQTIETVFQKHALPRGCMTHRETPVDPAAIRDTALLTIEGERDDISGRGQTEAAHALCVGLPDEAKQHLLQPKVGHYGIFSGRRWREIIAPKVGDFLLRHQR